MVFKNFRFQVILRVLLLAVALTALLWCLLDARYLRSAYAGVAVIIIVVEFIRYVDRFNRDVTTFMLGLLQHDFTTRFQSRKGKTFDELYDALNRITNVFKTISVEKETQFRFLEMLVAHLRVGILSFDETGKIHLANQAVKDLLQRDILFSLRSLESVDLAFVQTLHDIKSGETRLLKLRTGNELLQLSIHASEFRLEDTNHKLISMQNIRTELDAREMEAWQKLIRVLTHEIMNSVSPIISLSDTMHGLLQGNKDPVITSDANLYSTLDKGLEAIRVRGQGLFNFTQSYRKLTGIPKLSLENTSTHNIIEKVVTLMENQLKEKGIVLKTNTADIPIVVDQNLMQHVLINLLLNAAEAVSGKTSPEITIGALRNAKGGVEIYVRDNGEGIDDAVAEKIFIPFFTTRKSGSGIGLALTKQILQMHHGDIRFTSQKDKGTEFTIVL